MSSSDTYYWHDYETSGADPSCDRPMQFAGVRTNADLEVIGEPLVIYNRPTPDYLPHPGAIRVTGISPFTALEQGLSERDFIEAIHDELSAPGTCGVGYNSIRFDDEVTRFTLYRNFFDPYERERGKGRSRWDLIDVTRAFYALRPDGIEWPLRDDGQVSFRLEDLTAANGISHGNAHDAYSDVEATIAVARMLRKADRELFDTLFSMRSRDAVAALLDVKAMKPVLHVSGMIGSARGNLAAMIPLAVHPKIKSEIICADLSATPDFLQQDVSAIREALFTRKDELPEGVERPPLKTIRLNRAPAVLPMTWAKNGPAERWGLDGDRLRANLAAWRTVRDTAPAAFASQLAEIYAGREFPPRSDPDTMLYDGFFDWADKNQFPLVRDAAPDELGGQTFVFKDRRLPELLFRYRARSFPETLSEAEQARWIEHCRAQLSEGAFNLAQFDQELAEIMAGDLSERQREALLALSAYRQELAQHLQLAD